MPALSTTLRLTGRDVLSLLHRTTSNALIELRAGEARATLFCDFRGRLLHRAVVAVSADGAVWLLRADAPGAELAAAVDKMVFRDDVRIEDRSAEFAWALAEPGPDETASGVLHEELGVPLVVATGDGVVLARDGRAGLPEPERIARRIARHGHEIAEAFTPFEVGLAHEVHLAKGCFTGQEALQRLVTYESVRRRLAHVRLGSPVASVPVDVLRGAERAGVLTSAFESHGLAVLAHAVTAAGTRLALGDGTPLEVLEAPEPARPIGRP